MASQLAVWQGQFGNEYTDRNNSGMPERVPTFRAMLQDLDIRRILEVGCNRGINLNVLTQVLSPEAEIVGVEPNQHARELARAASPRYGVVAGNAYELPFRDGYFDLAFTCGVLIHIPADQLATAMREIARVSRRWILGVEYFAEQETVIQYRGHDALLWKRNFLQHYLDAVPGLKLLRSGDWTIAEGFDRSRWWLLEKSR